MRCSIIGFVAGVALLQVQPFLPTYPWLCAAVICALLLPIAARKLCKDAWIRAARLVVGATFGFVWAAIVAHAYLQQALPSSLEGRDLVIVGVVDSLPSRAEQGVRFNFQVESAQLDGQVTVIPSRISLGWYATLDGSDQTKIAIEPGERWQLAVRLQKPHGNANPGGFDYEVWLLQQKLRATGQVRTTSAAMQVNRRIDAFVPQVRTVVERMRGVLRDRILAALPNKPFAGAMVALVIGDQRAIAQSDWEIFNRTGIGHLVSISGLHITMIAGLFASLAHFLWRRSFFTGLQCPLLLPAQKVAALTGAVVALLYVLLAGFGIPAQRTLYMLWVVAAALWCGRIGSISHVLCIAALVVLVLDPWAVLWPGFWLSFFAVGIILYASTGRGREVEQEQEGALGRLPWRMRMLKQLRAASHTQYVVTIGLVPLTILLFGQISLVSPIANAIAIPLVTLLVTPLSLAGSVLPMPLSTVALAFAHTLFEWLASILTWFSALPGAVWTAPLPNFSMFLCGLIGTLWLLAPRGWPSRWLGIIGWLPLLCNSASFPVPGTMTITTFDIGQGTAVLIETASHRLLYDTGPLYSSESDGATRVLVPYLKARGIERLDGVIISHSDNDHSGGALSIFERIQVGLVVSSLPPDLPIVAAASAHRRCEAGQKWSWDGIDFEMLYPDVNRYDSAKLKPNARSCTLKITQGKHAILLPGDIESPQEAELVNTIPEKMKSTVLLAPHHGSGTSSTLKFLEAVQPQLAIFQVGYRNRYRHPKQQVLDRYEALGVRRVRSDESGAITLQFGDSVSFTEYRKTHARYWYGQ
ncbi:MAG: DNA internalization-related competence protein ComEC/Rec2 [Pseudomonadota bacterium]